MLHYFEYLNLLLSVLFLTAELMFFNGIRNMKYGRKFHFAGIYLSIFIFCLEFEKKFKIFQGLFSNFKLKIMIFEVHDTQFFGLL